MDALRAGCCVRVLLLDDEWRNNGPSDERASLCEEMLHQLIGAMWQVGCKAAYVHGPMPPVLFEKQSSVWHESDGYPRLTRLAGAMEATEAMETLGKRHPSLQDCLEPLTRIVDCQLMDPDFLLCNARDEALMVQTEERAAWVDHYLTRVFSGHPELFDALSNVSVLSTPITLWQSIDRHCPMPLLCELMARVILPLYGVDHDPDVLQPSKGIFTIVPGVDVVTIREFQVLVRDNRLQEGDLRRAVFDVLCALTLSVREWAEEDATRKRLWAAFPQEQW
jgi:hypothetical protein